MTPLQEAFRSRVMQWTDIQEHLPLLYDFACSFGKPRILELGSRKGNSTLAFLAGAETSGGHVWSCDIDNIITDPDGMKPWADCELWTFVRGDDMDPQVQAQLPAEADILFIDTSHEYEHTVREIEAYFPRVVRGGVALFHDTNFLFAGPDREWDGKPPPVGRAINDYCEKTGRKWTDLAGGYGMGLMVRE